MTAKLTETVWDVSYGMVTRTKQTGTSIREVDKCHEQKTESDTITIAGHEQVRIGNAQQKILSDMIRNAEQARLSIGPHIHGHRC
jgi:hypothetical protein